MALKIIGHRGSGRNEENPFANEIPPQHTRLSFEDVMNKGADGVEFDIFMSKDDVPVIIHRQGAIDLKVSERTVAEIQKIPLPQNQHILTLEECLEYLAELNERLPRKDMIINAELKGPGVVVRTRDIIEAVSSRTTLKPSQIYFDALEWDRLAHMRAVDPQAQLMPALSTARLFNMAGKGDSNGKPYDKDVMQELEAFIVDNNCCGIDVMTADIKPDMLALAQKLNVGFCSYPQGPHPRLNAFGIQHNIGLLDDYSRTCALPVIVKVEDVVATRAVLNAYQKGLPLQPEKIERVMGMRLT